MPFGMANSSKICCRWTTAWCKAFSERFHEKFNNSIILESYVDDFFGGPKTSKAGIDIDKRKAGKLFDQLIAVGELTGTKLNSKKCCPPARRMVILGFLYDAIAKRCILSTKTQNKYITRVNKVLEST